MGNKPSFEEKMRENKRRINRSIREIDRERVKLQNTEKKTIREIKKLAK
jgi:charged multivesicular body protein 2A